MPFLTFGLTWIFTLAIAPVALVAAIVTALIPLPEAKRIMWLSLGELAATVIGTATLGLLNTYAVSQR